MSVVDTAACYADETCKVCGAKLVPARRVKGKIRPARYDHEEGCVVELVESLQVQVHWTEEVDERLDDSGLTTSTQVERTRFFETVKEAAEWTGERNVKELMFDFTLVTLALPDDMPDPLHGAFVTQKKAVEESLREQGYKTAEDREAAFRADQAALDALELQRAKMLEE